MDAQAAAEGAGGSVVMMETLRTVMVRAAVKIGCGAEHRGAALVTCIAVERLVARCAHKQTPPMRHKQVSLAD